MLYRGSFRDPGEVRRRRLAGGKGTIGIWIEGEKVIAAGPNNGYEFSLRDGTLSRYTISFSKDFDSGDWARLRIDIHQSPRRYRATLRIGVGNGKYFVTGPVEDEKVVDRIMELLRSPVGPRPAMPWWCDIELDRKNLVVDIDGPGISPESRHHEILFKPPIEGYTRDDILGRRLIYALGEDDVVSCIYDTVGDHVIEVVFDVGQEQLTFRKRLSPDQVMILDDVINSQGE